MDIETNIGSKPYSVQHEIRKFSENVLINRKKVNNSETKQQQKVIKSLNERECVYVKADKGNKLVILEKSDYENRTQSLILESEYKSLRKDPLPGMVRQVKELKKQIVENFGIRLNWTLNVTNPEVPKLYCLPKIHKVGQKMRPIISNVNAPTEKIAKWLVSEIKKMKPIECLAVKNSFDLVNRLDNVRIEEDEIMVSFDVVALFPSVDVDEALLELNEEFIENEIPDFKRKVYMDAAYTCMNQNVFQFRGKFYKIEKGTSMGNSFSPKVAECFMKRFENRLKQKNILPRIWARYVDDVFAVVKKNEVDRLLAPLNEQYPSIKFTVERESNKSLNFLDLKLTNVNGKIKFAVHHKDTSSLRYITSDSHAPIQHKLAAFHSMVFRLCKLPLNILDFKSEYEYIKQIAVVNGYNPSLIDSLIKKHQRKIKRSNSTTFYRQQKQTNRPNRAVLSFEPEITNKLKGFLSRNHNTQTVFRSKSKLKNLLPSVKDKTDNLKKSGIYEISCGDCNAKYIGQSKRSITTRFKEHMRHIKYNQPSKSSVAEHVLSNDHFNISNTNLKLIRQVTNDKALDAYESFYIQREENSMNSDNGNIVSSLFKYCK